MTYLVRDAITDYIDWCRLYHTPAASREIESLLKKVPHSITRTSLNELTTRQLQKWLNSLEAATPIRQRRNTRAYARTYADRPRAATANRIFCVLRAVLNKAYTDGNIKDNIIWRRVKLLRENRVTRPLVDLVGLDTLHQVVQTHGPHYNFSQNDCETIIESDGYTSVVTQIFNSDAAFEKFRTSSIVAVRNKQTSNEYHAPAIVRASVYNNIHPRHLNMLNRADPTDPRRPVYMRGSMLALVSKYQLSQGHHPTGWYLQIFWRLLRRTKATCLNNKDYLIVRDKCLSLLLDKRKCSVNVAHVLQTRTSWSDLWRKHCRRRSQYHYNAQYVLLRGRVVACSEERLQKLQERARIIKAGQKVCAATDNTHEKTLKLTYTAAIAQRALKELGIYYPDARVARTVLNDLLQEQP